MPTAHVLPAADRRAIEDAVRAAESRTGCDIVVTVTRTCDAYQHAAWKAATCGALTGALATAAATRGLEVWGLAWAWLLLPAPAGAVLGWIAAQAAPVRRLLTAPELRAARVDARAALAFLEAEVFGTTARTGVLLFLSEFERRVVVLADQGVRQRVRAEELATLAQAVSSGVRRDTIGEALVDGVERVAALLEHHGFRAPHARANELADAVRLEES